MDSPRSRDSANPTHSEAPTLRMLTHSMEDYIKAIYKIQRRAPRATTLLIAARLGLSAASVTNMLKKLAEIGLVDYRPYQGAELTPNGKRIALEIVRHHRLIELYLTEHMGYSWDEVDAEAETLEHVISEAFEARMDALLGYPKTDPHGDPIPSYDGTLDETTYMPLSDMPLSDGRGEQRVAVMRVSDSNPRLLRDFARIGLVPTANLVILAPLRRNGRVRFRLGGDVHSISHREASNVFVQPTESESSLTITEPPQSLPPE